MERIILTVDGESVGIRLDKYLSEKIENLTRNSAQKLILDNSVSVNNKECSNNYKLKLNDEISVTIPDPAELKVEAENIPLDIIYEDDDLLVVNKPKGMVVHPAAGNYSGTLVNALLFHCKDSLSGINGVIRPGIVHRIDKNTSGLLIVAKNDFSHNALALQIKEHSFTREYEAVVHGNFKNCEGTIDAPIGRSEKDRKKMAVTLKNSKNARTHYTVLQGYRDFTHIRLRLETGRTHQIRVHMAYIHHPVAGDDVYGKPDKALQGQCLHARKLGFVHPTTNQYMEFNSDLPEYFINYLNNLKKVD